MLFDDFLSNLIDIVARFRLRVLDSQPPLSMKVAADPNIRVFYRLSAEEIKRYSEIPVFKEITDKSPDIIKLLNNKVLLNIAINVLGIITEYCRIEREFHAKPCQFAVRDNMPGALCFDIFIDIEENRTRLAEFLAVMVAALKDINSVLNSTLGWQKFDNPKIGYRYQQLLTTHKSVTFLTVLKQLQNILPQEMCNTFVITENSERFRIFVYGFPAIKAIFGCSKRFNYLAPYLLTDSPILETKAEGPQKRKVTDDAKETEEPIKTKRQLREEFNAGIRAFKAQYELLLTDEISIKFLSDLQGAVKASSPHKAVNKIVSAFSEECTRTERILMGHIKNLYDEVNLLRDKYSTQLTRWQCYLQPPAGQAQVISDKMKDDEYFRASSHLKERFREGGFLEDQDAPEPKVSGNVCTIS